MIVGMGTDIVEIARVEQSLARLGNKFAERILRPEELVIYRSAAQPERYLAKRYAAKEAAAKALGTGIGRGISFQHIAISNTDMGAPQLSFAGAAQTLCETRAIIATHISISDERHYAVATVILESK